MIHFFFSLIREPSKDDIELHLMFYFDTHIITKVTLNVRHTFFDKVGVFSPWMLSKDVVLVVLY